MLAQREREEESVLVTLLERHGLHLLSTLLEHLCCLGERWLPVAWMRVHRSARDRNRLRGRKLFGFHCCVGWGRGDATRTTCFFSGYPPVPIPREWCFSTPESKQFLVNRCPRHCHGRHFSNGYGAFRATKILITGPLMYGLFMIPLMYGLFIIPPQMKLLRFLSRHRLHLLHRSSIGLRFCPPYCSGRPWRTSRSKLSHSLGFAP